MGCGSMMSISRRRNLSLSVCLRKAMMVDCFLLLDM